VRSALPFVIAAILVIGGFYLLSSLAGGARERQLERSVMGFDGLVTWLDENDIDLEPSNPRLSPDTARFALQILPLADTDLSSDTDDPQTSEEAFYQTTQRDIAFDTYDWKIYTLPTLVILPKWRSGFASVRVADDSVITPQSDLRQLMLQIGLQKVKFISPRTLLTEEKLQGAGLPAAAIVLYQARVFDRETLPDTCTEIAGIASGALAITCSIEDNYPPTTFLSDPDLMNNHGMSLGENSRFAPAILALLAAGDDRPIYLDRAPDFQLLTDQADEGIDYDRGSSELGRLFDYPFSVFWFLLAVSLGIAFWRGGVRFGPAVRPADRLDDQASKTAAIEAKARLLRVSGQDQRMVADFVRTRLRDHEIRVAGTRTDPGGDGRLRKLLAQRDPALADSFFAAAAALTGQQGLSPGDLMRQLPIFKDLEERVNHATGRVSRPY
jgi:hypothetical protein